MPTDIVSGQDNHDDVQQEYIPDEDLYDEVLPVEPRGYQGNEIKVDNKHYENMDTPPIYQNIHQINRKRQTVYGEVHFAAKGYHFNGQWDPSFLKGISSYPPEVPHLELEEIVTQISDTPVNQRNPKHVEFLLHTVLPDLETKLTKNGITSDILRILLKLSCCKDCSVVTRYALHIVLDTLLKTSYDSGGIFADFVVQCELCLKYSIIGQVQGDISAFDHENAEDQGLRLFVYSRALIILYANVVQGLIPMATINENRENFKALVQKLDDLKQDPFFSRKDKVRYAIRCIEETVSRISAKQKKKQEGKNNWFLSFLIWLKEHNSGAEVNKVNITKGVGDFVSKIKASKKGWFDFHVAVFCLVSQLHLKSKNIAVLRGLVDEYLERHSDCVRKWSSEGEWQTGLVLASVLEEIANSNQDRGTRTETCLCLIHFFVKLRGKNSLEKLCAKESLNRCLYGPDRNLRKVILDHLEMGGDKTSSKKEITRENMKEFELLPITSSMNYLEHRYKRQIQPGSRDFITTNNFRGFFTTSFRGEKAIVKILTSTKDNMVREEINEPSTIHQLLVTEVYTLRRLNSKPHPNILRVFAYDTSAQPYHLITEHVSKGSLLKFLHDSRSHAGPMPGPSILIQMILGVMDATIYLNEQHLVHLAIMATNVLVGIGNVCKLTGFQSIKEMTKQDGSYEFVDGIPEAIRHAAPECFTSGRFSEKSVSWAIGILLFEMHTYGVSPYNQFNDHEHDQIQRHVTGGGKLNMEDCIRKEVCLVIQKCLPFEREERPSLYELKIKLKIIYDQLIKEENDRPAASYPSLTNVDLAQTTYAMDSSNGIEGGDKERNLGFFGSPTRSEDIPIIRIKDGVRFIRELVSKTKAEDMEKLKKLQHKNIVKLISLSNYDAKYNALVTEDSARGNLLQMVLDKHCRPEVLITFAAQIAKAMIYMHDNDMIHADLRAEHIMVFTDKVKLARLGRSKHVGKMVDTKCCKPNDGIRWTPPEVIKDGIYSQSSDVYSFGVTCFELFNALSAKEGSTPEDVKPFSTIKDKQILGYIEGNNRPDRPVLMQIWLHLVVKQCLLHKPAERPPFPLIEDALTSRRPFESCLLFHWMEIHKNEVSNIDRHVTQPERASHLIVKEHHRTFKELESLAAVEVFLRHTYSYKPGNKNFAEEDLNGLYDDIYTYNKANVGFPNVARIVNDKALRDPNQEQRECDDSENNCYEMISRSSTKAEYYRRQMQPLPSPPCDSGEKLPVQESGDLTIAQRNSELASYASTSVLNKNILPSYHKACDPDDTLYGQVDADTPHPDWPSLPAPSNIVKVNTICSSSCRGESSNVPQTSYNTTLTHPVCDNQEDVHTVDDDEGAVRGEPVESSYHSLMPYPRDQEQECISMNNNNPEAMSGSRDMNEIKNCTSRDNSQAPFCPVPKPRTNKTRTKRS